MEWRLIETSPADTYLLVWCPDYLGFEHVIAAWDSASECWVCGDPEEPLEFTPSHWMPLPEAPEESYL